MRNAGSAAEPVVLHIVHEVHRDQDLPTQWLLRRLVVRKLDQPLPDGAELVHVRFLGQWL
ncbi:MAG TPA: hypothetical protein VGI39_34520 [Polyangiaceae bacterium]